MPSNVGLKWWFLGCATAALLGLGTSVFWLNDSQVLTPISVLLPLLAYHARLWLAFSRKESLSSAYIDSVYYLGFLITVCTLGFTVVSLGAQGSFALRTPDALGKIGRTFGLGLLATGYALIARIHLILSSSVTEEEQLGVKVDRYAIEAQRALEVMRRSAGEYDAFAAMVRKSTLDSHDALSKATIQTISTANRELSQAFKETTEQLRNMVSSYRMSIEAATPLEDANLLRETIRQMSYLTGQLQARINKLNLQVDQTAEATKGLEIALSGATHDVTSMGSSVLDLHTTTTALKTLSPHIENLSDSLSKLADLSVSVSSSLEAHERIVAKQSGVFASELRDHNVFMRNTATALHEIESMIRSQIEAIRTLAPDTRSLRDSQDLAESSDRKLDSIARSAENIAVEVKLLSASLTAVAETNTRRLSES